MSGPDSGQRLAFVGGLHRSGTTPFTRWLGQHPEVSDFRDTGVPEDEGQHLQDVYPTAGQHGGAGRFALDPDSHLTESSPLVSERSRARLWETWSPHWEQSRRLLIEKSPPNLVRTRFLQELFGAERTYFLIVMRHPIAVTYATKKAKRSPRLTPLVRHWLAGYETFLEDAPKLRNLLVVRYEDLVTDPQPVMTRAFEFLGLERFTAEWPASGALNDRYLSRWRGSRVMSPVPLKRELLLSGLERRYDSRFEPFGYSLAEPERIGEPAPEVARYMRAGEDQAAELS